MYKSFRTSRFLAAAALMAVAMSASAGIVTSNAGVKYDTTLTTNDASKGGSLKLTIDATGRYTNDPDGWLGSKHADLKYATELDQIQFKMKRMDGGSMTSVSSGDVSDWKPDFENNGDWWIFIGDDYLTFTAKSNNHTLLTSPLTFEFNILGNGLDFNSLALTTDYLTQTPKYNKGKLTGYTSGNETDSLYLSVTTQSIPVIDPEVPPVSEVPEPASIAMLGAGLGMMGFMRRRKTAAA